MHGPGCVVTRGGHGRCSPQPAAPAETSTAKPAQQMAQAGGAVGELQAALQFMANMEQTERAGQPPPCPALSHLSPPWWGNRLAAADGIGAAGADVPVNA